MPISKWRMRAAPIIARVLEETRGRSEAEIRRALLDAFPWGERKCHPYLMWRKEIRHQRGLLNKPAIPPTGPSLFDLEDIHA